MWPTKSQCAIHHKKILSQKRILLTIDSCVSSDAAIVLKMTDFLKWKS